VKLRYAIVGVVAGAIAFSAVAFGGAGGPQTKLVSRNSAGDPAANGSSFPGGITPNAQWVAFSSEADNLPGASSGVSQVYLRDRQTGKTKLVSRSNNGDPGDDGSYDPTLSDDGRFVAFESLATNLPGSLGPTYYQVYVRDLKNGTTKLLSRLSGGDPASGGSSTDPSIAGNGRLVAFESYATNLPGDISPDDQVYLRDRKSGKTKLVSKTTGGTPADGDSEDPAVSPNGRIVGFESEATNLPGGLGSGDDQVYVRNLAGGRTLLVSRTSGGSPGDDESDNVSISRNGRFVEFESQATNLPGSLGPTYTQVYLRDRKQDKTTLISKTSGGDPATGGYSDYGSTSANGRFVEFESSATNLPGEISPDYQVYLRDRETGKTKLVSRSNNGDPGDETSYMRRNNNLLSRDPMFAAFYSYATNLPGSIGPTYSQAYIRGPGP
jgi:WD40-like Beta Propeller Repeat